MRLYQFQRVGFEFRNKIKTDNPYLRLESNPDLEKLKKSIETIGLINPLIVNQDFELIAGGRRFSALKEMGRTEVPITKISVNKLEEELISIDENLVRRPLNKLELEKCLGRAKDLYEKLYPEAAKVTLEELNSKDEEKRPLGGKPSFSALTAEKTGLSEASIKGAIKRGQLSSDAVKKARMHGELSTTSANEIIKLSKNDQEELLPHLLGRPLKDIKKIVKKAHVEGAKRAIEVSEEIPTIPKEFSELQNMAKKLNKALSKIILDSLEYSGDEYADIFKELNLLEVNLSQLLSHSNGATSYTIDTHSEETRSSIGKGENLEEIQLQH